MKEKRGFCSLKIYRPKKGRRVGASSFFSRKGGKIRAKAFIFFCFG